MAAMSFRTFAGRASTSVKASRVVVSLVGSPAAVAANPSATHPTTTNTALAESRLVRTVTEITPYLLYGSDFQPLRVRLSPIHVSDLTFLSSPLT
jgi:hypothetical protein